MHQLSKKIDAVLKEKNMSTTNDYINRINEGIYKGKEKKAHVIANHINICNYCRPEKAAEARDIIISNISKTIVLDKIAFRFNGGQHGWEIKL